MTREFKPKQKIRYAVVGLGHIVQVAVLPAFENTNNSQLVALISGDPEKRDKLSKKYKLKRAYSYEELEQALAEVDAVYIGVPNHLHREYAVRAARAGVHVLCEKPMAVIPKECEDMMQAAEEHKVKLMIAYRLHFEKANLEAIRLVKSGQLGDVRAFTSEFAQQVAPNNVRITEPTEKGGGPVFDMGVYCINAARYLFQDEPTKVLAVAASTNDPRFKKTDEMVSVMLSFPQERTAAFTCSFGAADISRYTVIGTKGTLTAEPAYDYSVGLKHRMMIGEKTTSKSFPKRDQFAAEIEYFSSCVLEDKEPEPSGMEGLADVEIIQRIYESIRDGKTVQIPAIAKKPKPSEHQEIHKPAHEKPETVHAKSPTGEAA